MTNTEAFLNQFPKSSYMKERMNLEHYKASAERTDADERALIPAFKRTQPTHKIDRKRVELFQTRIDACDTLLDYLHDDLPWSKQEPLKHLLQNLKRNLEDQLTEGIQSCHE